MTQFGRDPDSISGGDKYRSFFCISALCMRVRGVWHRFASFYERMRRLRRRDASAGCERDEDER